MVDGRGERERGWRKRKNRVTMTREKGMARKVRQAGRQTDKAVRQTDR